MQPEKKRKETVTESETQIKVKKVTSTRKTSPPASTSGRSDPAPTHQTTSRGTNITPKHQPMPNNRITRASLRSSLKVKPGRTSVKSVVVTRGFLRQSKTKNPPEASSRWMINAKEVKLSNKDEKNTLFEASHKGSIEIVRDLLLSGADINHQSTGGWTPVMTTVVSGYKQLFDLLVEQGCDLSLKFDNSNTILHIACSGNNADIVKYVVSHNVENIESKGVDGQTPVMEAASVGSKIIFDFLVSQGCDLKTTNNTGDNILHLASLSGNVDIVSYILANHIVDIDTKGEYERTPVMKAAENGQKHVFEFLVSQRCDLASTDEFGYNILHLACFSGNVDVVGYILSHNIVDINSKGEYGRTPVMSAAENGQKNVFDFLVSQGCDLTITDENGYNILHLASFCDDIDVVNYILSHDIVDINSKDVEWGTPVMLAAENGQKHVFDVLVSQGCDLTLKDQKGDNILHLACLRDNVDIVGYILSQNIADINSKGAKGRTPVMTAAENGQKLVFDFLVSQGCDLTLVDNRNNNILHLAAIGGSVDIVTWILRKGIVDIDGMNNYGRTALRIAKRYKQNKVASLLVDRGASETDAL